MGKTFNTGRLGNGLFVDANGNVGIGTTSPTSIFEIYTGTPKITFTPSAYSGSYKTMLGTRNGAEGVLQLGNNNPNYIVAGNSATGGSLHFYVNATSDFITSTNGTLAMVITSGGNIGIGTSSPNSLLDVKGANPFIRITDSVGSGDYGFIMDAGGGFIRGGLTINSSTGEYKSFCGVTGNSYFQTFLVNGSERMRITTGGQVLIGQTTASGNSNGIYFRPGIESGFIVTSDIALQLSRLSTTGDIQSFYSGTTRVGTISVSSSNTSYNTSSDYRLKEDLKDYNGLDLVSKIKTYDFAWKNDQTRNYGVIAHEIAEIIPYVVMGEKDGEFYQGVDYSKLVPILVKAIQELKAEIDILNNK